MAEPGVCSRTWSRRIGGGHTTIHLQVTQFGPKTLYIYLGDNKSHGHHQLNHITFASPTTTTSVNPVKGGGGGGVLSTRVLGGGVGGGYGGGDGLARRLSRVLGRPIILAMEVEILENQTEFEHELEKYIFNTITSSSSSSSSTDNSSSS